MGFKLPGRSIQAGTSAHRSALKMKASAVKERLAYGGDRTWGTAQKQSVEAGGDLNQTTRDQRAYEKEMKSKDPSWNKREDNTWKKRQNIINKAVGSKKVYDVESDKVTDLKEKQVVTDKEIVDKGEEKMAKKGPQQTNEEGEKVFGAALDVDKKLTKSEKTTSNKIARQKVRDARKEHGRGSDEVKAAKAERKETKAKNKAMVKTGKKDRAFVKKDEKLDRKITRRKAKGKSTTRLEGKKARNLQKEKEFGESLGATNQVFPPEHDSSPTKHPTHRDHHALAPSKAKKQDQKQGK